MSKKSARPTVAEFLAFHIDISDKAQKDIAAEIGYDKPNVLTMIKQGKTKLPLTKVGPIAKAIDADPAYLLRLALTEYAPRPGARSRGSCPGSS